MVKSRFWGHCHFTQSQKALELGGGWLLWKQVPWSFPSFRGGLLHLGAGFRSNGAAGVFSQREGSPQQTEAEGCMRPAHAAPGALPGLWFHEGDFEGCGLYCVCGKMERKFLDGSKDSMPIRRKEKYYSLIQKGCQPHLQIKQPFSGEVC